MEVGRRSRIEQFLGSNYQGLVRQFAIETDTIEDRSVVEGRFHRTNDPARL